MKPAAEARSPAPAAQAKAPAWSDLDAALTSLKFQSCKAALGHANLSKCSNSDTERKRAKKWYGQQP